MKGANSISDINPYGDYRRCKNSMSNKKNAGRKAREVKRPQVNIHRNFTNQRSLTDILYSIAILNLKEKE